MSGRRKIKAKHVWLFKEDNGYRIAIETHKGAQIDIHFHPDADDAVCAIRTLSPIVAETIRAERRHHEWQRQRLADAWSLADQAIKGTTPGGAQ